MYWCTVLLKNQTSCRSSYLMRESENLEYIRTQKSSSSAFQEEGFLNGFIYVDQLAGLLVRLTWHQWTSFKDTFRIKSVPAILTKKCELKKKITEAVAYVMPRMLRRCVREEIEYRWDACRLANLWNCVVACLSKETVILDSNL